MWPFLSAGSGLAKLGLSGKETRMPRTPIGHFRRNPVMRYGYGAFLNYRLAEVTRGAGAAGAETTFAPPSVDSGVDVTYTLPAAAGDVALQPQRGKPAYL